MAIFSAAIPKINRGFYIQSEYCIINIYIICQTVFKISSSQENVTYRQTFRTKTICSYNFFEVGDINIVILILALVQQAQKYILFILKNNTTSFTLPIQLNTLLLRFMESGLKTLSSQSCGRKSTRFCGCFSPIDLMIINNNGCEAALFLYISNSFDICLCVNAYNNKKK